MDYEQQEVNDKPSNLQILFIEFAVIFFVIAIPYFFYGLYKDTHVDEEKKVKRVLNRMEYVLERLRTYDEFAAPIDKQKQAEESEKNAKREIMANVTFPDYKNDNQPEQSEFEKMFPFLSFDAIFPGLNDAATFTATMNARRPTYTNTFDTNTIERNSIAYGVNIVGYELERIGKDEEAIALYDELYLHFGDEKEPGVRYWMAAVLHDKGVLLEKMKQYEAAIKVYDEVVERFGEDSSLFSNTYLFVAEAYINKGSILEDMDKPGEALRVYNELLERPGDSDQDAKALIRKAAILENFGKYKEALEIYNKVEKHYRYHPAYSISRWAEEAASKKIECKLKLQNQAQN